MILYLSEADKSKTSDDENELESSLPFTKAVCLYHHILLYSYLTDPSDHKLPADDCTGDPHWAETF